jgi:flagellar assembly factor FliW
MLKSQLLVHNILASQNIKKNVINFDAPVVVSLSIRTLAMGTFRVGSRAYFI